MTTSKQAVLGLRVASWVFAIVAIAHLARWCTGWNVQVGAYGVGLNVSAAAVFLSLGFSLWLWKLAVSLNRPSTWSAPPADDRFSPREETDLRRD